MKNITKMKKNGLYLMITAGGLSLLTACNGGNSSSSTTPAVNSSPLAQYKSMLTYAPAGNKNSKNAVRAIGDTKQQSFTVPNGTTLNLLDVRVTTFSTSTCTFGSELGVVEMNGGAGVDFPAGTYASSNQSNNTLYTRMVTAMTSGTPQAALGVRFDYHYNTASGGPGWVSADCMATGLADYETTNPGTACAGGSATSACGFDVAQTELLPSIYRDYAYVTDIEADGDLLTAARAICTGSGKGQAQCNALIPDGYQAANYICNSDAGKPKTAKASLAKALLYGNQASQLATTYYNINNQVWATATDFGNNLTYNTINNTQGNLLRLPRAPADEIFGAHWGNKSVLNEYGSPSTIDTSCNSYTSSAAGSSTTWFALGNTYYNNGEVPPSNGSTPGYSNCSTSEDFGYYAGDSFTQSCSTGEVVSVPTIDGSYGVYLYNYWTADTLENYSFVGNQYDCENDGVCPYMSSGSPWYENVSIGTDTDSVLLNEFGQSCGTTKPLICLTQH